MQFRGILRIFFFVALLSSTFIAWYVTPVKSAVLQVPGQYPTIQQAVNAAGSGDIIEVAAGTYFENVIVTVRGLTIVGDNAATTIVDGGGNDAVFKIQEDNVELRELTICNGKPYYNGVNMFTPYGGLVIRNTRIIDNAFGVYIYESGSNTIEDNIFIDNSLYGIDAQYSTGNIIRDNQISESAYGIEVSDTSSSQVVNNTVSGASYAIYAPSSNNNNISSNTLFDNSWNIYLTYSNSNTVGNNAISGDGAVGIQIMRSKDNSIFSNTIDNSSYGIFLGYCGANTVTDNWVSLADWGIELFNSSGSTIKENMISDNAWGFYVVDTSRGNYIYHNNVIDNVKQAYQDPITSGQNSWRTPTTPFEGNYWSNYIGADDGTGGRTAGDGIGDTYLPWEGVDSYPLMNPWGIAGDVAVISITPSAPKVYAGQMVDVIVVVENQGLGTDNFNVTAKYENTTYGVNGTAGKQEVTNLAPGANATLTFTWNTTDVPPGNYTISAEATQVLGEVDVSDNSLIDGMIHVKIPGDINSDGVVDIIDAGLISAHWYPGPPVGPFGYGLDADINDDGLVDIFDAAIVSANWLESEGT